MSTNLSMTLAEAVDAALAGQRSMILCPAHPDKNPSLSVRPGNSQPVVLHCHTEVCTVEEIIEASGLDWDEICNQRDTLDALASGTDNWTPVGKASHIYPYRDETGKVLYEVMRVPLPNGEKTFRQRRPDPERGDGKHAWNLEGCRRVPYRLPELLQAIKDGRSVHIFEGEKDVHNALRILPEGDAATTNAMGAGKWDDQWSAMFEGANVTVYADADDPGRAHARFVRECLIRRGASVRIMESPVAKDFSAHLEAGSTLDDFLETTPESMAERARTGIDVIDMLARPVQPTEWAIENTLALGDRLLLIGLEGHGKSTLLRQMAVCTAAGIHPWTGREIAPKRVLMIDGENHPSQVRQSYSDLVRLCEMHGRPVEPGMLTILEEWDGQRDITTEAGTAWLEERMWAYRPHMVVMGPLTNMVKQDLKRYEPVDELREVIDNSRKVCNSALVMEHHAPKRGTGDKIREVVPYGSGLFLKWPDFGFAMVPTETAGVYDWEMNRGPRVRGRHWPMALRMGEGPGEFPWMECESPAKPKRR